jgi:hypothetical protein
MKIATQLTGRWQSVLAGGLALAGLAHACATPVEVEGCQPTAPGARECDVILAQASDFGDPDASVPFGQGGNAGSGSNPPGNAGSGSNPPPGGAGSGGGGAPPTGGSAGSSAAGSSAGGAAGSGAGGAGSAGAGGSGTAGTGTGVAGSGSAGTGSGGTGSTSNFDLDSCDLQNQAGCEEFACATACPQNMGNYCSSNCAAILTCVAADTTCISEADPMCGVPSQNPYTENQCTNQVNMSGNANTAGTPANVALALIRCLCSDPRP